MKITIKARVNKMVKDSKKEMIQFHVTGDEKRNNDFSTLTGEVTEIFVEGCAHRLTTEFKKTVGDVNKLVLEFELRGDVTRKQTGDYYDRVGTDVTLTIASAQMSIEEFKQASIDDEYEEEDADPNQAAAEFEELD